MKLYLVRHGQTLSRDGMSHVEGKDVALSARGKKEARSAAQFLKSKNISMLIASPMVRARETAEIISKQINLPIFFEERIAEHAPSHTLTGKAFKELKSRTRREPDFVPENGESFNQAADRFIAVLTEAVRENKNTALISHALVIQTALVKLFDLKNFPHLDTGSISVLSYENNAWHLISINKKGNPFSRFLSQLKKKFL